MSDLSIKDIVAELMEKYGVDVPNLTNEEWQRKKIADYNETTGTLNEIDGYNCALCKNKGHSLVLSEDGVELYRECRCIQTRATLQRAKKSGLGDVLTEYTFGKYAVTEDWQNNLKRTAEAFCTDEGAKWFFIGGTVGCGKTHLCTAIVAHYIKAGYEAKYMLWAEEAKKLKALVNDESYTGLIEKYKRVPVLYIDDFLKVKQGEQPTAADINLAFEIINHRLINKEAITIISSEKMLDEIMDYDEATMSRIYLKTGSYKLNIPKDRAKNYRLRG